MRFHEYKLSKNMFIDMRDMAVNEFYEQSMKAVKTNRKELEERIGVPEVGRLILEAYYVSEGMPFYNIYPKIVEALKNTSLDFTMDDLVHEKAHCFSVNLPYEGCLLKDGNNRITSLLICPRYFYTDGKKIKHIGVLADTLYNKDWGFYNLYNKKGLTINEDMRRHDAGSGKEVLSVAVGLLLLKENEDMIEPILLKRDQGKSFATKEEYERAVARAHRRGRKGWTIGKNFEVSPHVRRPHFAIRWMEKGRRVPRLRPIKGCVVNKSKVFPIPTGYKLGEVVPA